jgi:hypothetical protein
MDVVEIVSRAHVVVRRVQHLVTYRHPTQTPLCKYFEHHTPGMVTPRLIRNALRQSLQAIGHTTLGIHPQDIDAFVCQHRPQHYTTTGSLEIRRHDTLPAYCSQPASTPTCTQDVHRRASIIHPTSQPADSTHTTTRAFSPPLGGVFVAPSKQSPLHATQASQPCPPTASFFPHNGPLGRAGENQDQWESEKLGSYKL